MATSGNYLTSQVHNAYVGDGCPDRANISWSATWDSNSMLWTVNWSANGAGYTNNNYVTIFSGTVTITDNNGNTLQTKSMSGQIAYARKDVQLVSGSFTTGVDLNGDRQLAFSATFRIGVNGSTGESTGSQTFNLDNIPLASSISSVTSPVSVPGGTCTVLISRNSSSYTHLVTWTFGSYSYTTPSKVATSASYTIPASWLNAISNAPSGTGSVTVTTYNGATKIGEEVSKPFTVNAVANPTISSASVAVTGNPSGVTGYIAGVSRARVTGSTMAGIQGSKISRIDFYWGTTLFAYEEYSTKPGSVSSLYKDTGLLSGSSATFKVKVTDTRGRTAEASTSEITISAYATPSITANAFRCNASGVADSTGNRLRITATATATPSGNAISSGYPKYATKATSDQYWGSDASIGSGVTTGADYPNTTSYQVRITAKDNVGNYSYTYLSIPTAAFTMDFKVDGNGVAFGKVAETDNLVDSAWGFRTSKTGAGEDAGVAVINGVANTDTAVTVRRTDSNREIELLVGSGGVNRGLYVRDGNMDGWLLYYNDSNAFVSTPFVVQNSAMALGNIWAGNGSSDGERDVGVRTAAGDLYIYGHASASGNRGIYMNAHGTGAARGILTVGSNNNVYWYGDSFNATDAVFSPAVVSNRCYGNIGYNGGDYRRVAIALCDASSSNNNSWWSGRITYNRYNGVVAMPPADVEAHGRYQGGAHVWMHSDQEIFLDYAATGTEGWRPCTFTYNGKQYGGIEAYCIQGGYFECTGGGSFTPFLVQYYNPNSWSAINSEIYNSISFNVSRVGKKSGGDDSAVIATGISTTENTFSYTYGKYSAFVVIGTPGSSAKSTCYIPKAAITTSYVSYQITDESYYIVFDIKHSGDTLYIKVNRTNNGTKYIDLYGIN